MDIVKIPCALAGTASDVCREAKAGRKGTRRSFSHGGMGGGITEHW